MLKVRSAREKSILRKSVIRKAKRSFSTLNRIEESFWGEEIEVRYV